MFTEQVQRLQVFASKYSQSARVQFLSHSLTSLSLSLSLSVTVNALLANNSLTHPLTHEGGTAPGRSRAPQQTNLHVVRGGNHA